MDDISLSSSLANYNDSIYKGKGNKGKGEEAGGGPSYLSSDAIRWMNKRRVNTGKGATTLRVLPSRALQLKNMFKGLDFDDSGSIDIAELQEAVTFVSRNDKGDDKIFKDPQKLTEFFVSMDTDRNGTVDFNEFMIGMSSDGSGDTAENTARLQQMFYDFANQHRRQLLVDRITEVNGPTTEISKFQDMKKIFGIAYFKDDVIDLTLEEKLARMKADALRDKAELNTDLHTKLRQNELERARAAAMRFGSERNTLKGILNPILTSLEAGQVPDSKRVNRSIEERLIRDRCKLKGDPLNTFVPNVDIGGRHAKDMKKKKAGIISSDSLNLSASNVSFHSSTSLGGQSSNSGPDRDPGASKLKTTRLRVVGEINRLKNSRTTVNVQQMAANKPDSVKIMNRKTALADSLD